MLRTKTSKIGKKKCNSSLVSCSRIVSFVDEFLFICFIVLSRMVSLRSQLAETSAKTACTIPVTTKDNSKMEKCAHQSNSRYKSKTLLNLTRYASLGRWEEPGAWDEDEKPLPVVYVLTSWAHDITEGRYCWHVLTLIDPRTVLKVVTRRLW